MYSNIKQQISTMQKLQLLLHLINVFEVILFTTKCHMTSGISSMELCLVRTQHCPRACFLTLLISMNDSSGQGFSLIRSLPWNMHRWVTSVYSGPVLCGRCRRFSKGTRYCCYQKRVSGGPATSNRCSQQDKQRHSHPSSRHCRAALFRASGWEAPIWGCPAGTQRRSLPWYWTELLWELHESFHTCEL